MKGVKNFFNTLFYEKKKVLFPVIITSFLMGAIITKFLVKIDLSLLSLIVLLMIINITVQLSFTYLKSYDEIRRNSVLKQLYFSLNLICFEIFLYLNYNDIKDKFTDVKISFMPREIYIVVLLTAAFLLFIWLIYVVMFSSIKMTKITTSGVEVQVDDTAITEKQNQILNSLQSSIEKSMRINGELNRISAEFILHNVIDSNRQININYSYKDLFNCLRKFSNEMFSTDCKSVIVDYKTIAQLNQIKKEYNIPNNLYNKIYSRIDGLSEGKNDVFTERNLVFINYKFQSIEHDELSKNRVIGIIEFKGIKEGYSDYGSLLIMSIKMFDYICALTLSSLN